MTGHHEIPLKIKPFLFTSCLNRANDRAKFDYWGGRKNYCSSVSMVWWYGDTHCKGFSNSHVRGTD